MKTVLTRTPRFRVALALSAMLGLLPTASLVQSAQADPPRHAPAYGYRRKNDKKADKRDSKRYKRDYKKDYKRNNDYRDRDNRDRDYSNRDRDNRDRDNRDRDSRDRDNTTRTRQYSRSNRR